MSSSRSATAGARPRFRSVPPAPSSAGLEAVELAASAGLHLDPWQQDVLVGALAENDDGGWASTEVAVVVPRQNGKGSILEARELFGLFLDDRERLQTHTAHRFDTCLEHFKRIRDLIENTPDLARKVKRIREANGDEGIELLDGSRLNFKARSKGSGRGFSGDLVVLDEAFWLMELGSLIPTMSGRPNPQVWYTSSAPLPRVESDVLRRLIKRGRAGGVGTYFEWSTDDPEKWRDANPAVASGRMSEEFVAIEKGSLTTAEFDLERCGIFPVVDESPQWEVIAEQVWSSCSTQEKPPAADIPGWLSGPVSLGIAMPNDRSSAVIAAAGACREGGVGVEIATQRQGVGWLVSEVLALIADREIGAVVIDPKSPAANLIAPLRDAGVDVTEIKYAELVQAHSSIYDAATAGDIVHRDRPELDTAVAHAKRRTIGDAWLLDRRTGHDVSPLDAVIQARWGHLRKPAVSPDSVYETRDPVTL